jgi:phenylpyruvate tautomerase PptA (4-oxalocrotonate tautomerase family)
MVDEFEDMFKDLHGPTVKAAIAAKVASTIKTILNKDLSVLIVI